MLKIYSSESLMWFCRSNSSWLHAREKVYSKDFLLLFVFHYFRSYCYAIFIFLVFGPYQDISLTLCSGVTLTVLIGSYMMTGSAACMKVPYLLYYLSNLILFTICFYFILYLKYTYFTNKVCI